MVKSGKGLLVYLYCEKIEDGIALFDLHSSSPEAFLELGFIKVYSSRRFRSGKWYCCRLRKFKAMIGLGSGIDANLFIEDLNKEIKSVSTKKMRSFFFRSFPRYSTPDTPGISAHVYDAVKVYYAGDGNASKVFSKGSPAKIPSIWFDYGCGSHADISVVANVLENERGDDDVIVISHWDLDHSNCLGYINKRVRSLIAANEMPTTIRREKIIAHLASLGTDTHTLGFGTRKGLLELDRLQFGNVEIWKPSKDSDRNKSSYVLFSKNVASLVLAGDQHYAPICNSISPLALNNMLLPHHGGCAGKKPANLGAFLTGNTIVSCSAVKRKKAPGALSWPLMKSCYLQFTYRCMPSITIDY
jgi:hypothetical protein